MLQRVLSKRDLAGTLKTGGGGNEAASSKKSSAFSRDELRELFSLDMRTRCGTRKIMLKKDKVNYGRRMGGTGNGIGEEEEATKKWRQTAVACAPGDAEAGAPEISAGDGHGLADGKTQLLAAVLATGRVSWVHEEDGKASATEEEGEEGGKVEAEVKVEEEEDEEGEALPAAAAAVPFALPDDTAAAIGKTSIDDESHLEVE